MKKTNERLATVRTLKHQTAWDFLLPDLQIKSPEQEGDDAARRIIKRVGEIRANLKNYQGVGHKRKLGKRK